MTDTVQVPHLKVPLNFDSGQAELVEQDSLDEVAQCAATVIATPIGYREHLPEFGSTDQVFKVGGVDEGAIRAALDEWEPRAEAEIDKDDTLLDELVAMATVNVELSGEES